MGDAVIVAAVLNNAFAQSITSCVAGDAPAAYIGTGCNAECTIGGIAPQKYIICTASSESIAVEDYAQTGDRTYSAWGVDTSSDTYCCFVNDDVTRNIVSVTLYGTSGGDTLSLSYSGRNIEHAGTRIYAQGEADTLTGSDAAMSSPDNEFLFGEGGPDLILGYDGDDYLYGEGDVDVIEGGDGDDYIEGGVNADEIYGEAGVDTCHGDGGNDFIDGGDGDDVLYGDGDDDVLWGEGDNDSLYGGRGADVLCGGSTTTGGTNYLHAVEPGVTETTNQVDWLWQPSSAAAPTGGGAVTGDECGHSTHAAGWAGASCDYTNATRPAECYQ